MVIVQETLAELGGLNGTAGNNRQPGSRVVAEGLVVFVDKFRGPVWCLPDFETVQHQGLQSLRLFAVAKNTAEHDFEMAVGRLGTHMIDDQPIGIRAWYFQCLTSPGADEAEKRPIARRNLPREPSRPVNLARKVYRLNSFFFGPCLRDS